MVDIRDVAAAHTLALFHPSAKGRYVCSAASYMLSDMCKILSELFPTKIRAPWMAPPKWLLYLVGPLLGLPRDLVT